MLVVLSEYVTLSLGNYAAQKAAFLFAGSMDGSGLKKRIAAGLIAICLLFAPVYADSYQIPLWSSGYPSLTVSVGIPQGWAADGVRQAMQIWNAAQIWFAKTYFPKGAVYTFTESGAHYVHITWMPYSPTVGGESAGNCISEYGMNCSVLIVLTDSTGTNLSLSDIVHVALHEFGHVLGLGHADPTKIPNDLMNHEWNSALSPSTLDLYAVHLLADAQGTASNLAGGEVVTLPANIPYMNYETTSEITYTPYTYPTYPTTSNAVTTFAYFPTTASSAYWPLQMPQLPSIATQSLLIIILVGILAVALGAFFYYWMKPKPKQSDTKEAKKGEVITEKKTEETSQQVPPSVRIPAPSPPQRKLCEQCGNEMPSNLMFCDTCGAEQGSRSVSAESPRRCVKCDSELPPKLIFCNNCGAKQP